MTNEELLNEITNGPLKDELADALAAGDDITIYNVLNRKDIPSPGEITSHDIKQYLSLIGVRIPIMESTANACKAATVALDDFPLFKLTIPEVYAKFVEILDGLVAEVLIPTFTEDNKQALLYLASKQVSRAEQLGITISQADVARALKNDDGTVRVLP
jgi:hypothetical protein